MTQEEKFVVNPLEKYFLSKKRSGAKWIIKHRPQYGTSETGWDLQVERKNQVLFIEAKYIRGPFASALAGLVIAPLTNKQEKMKSGKRKSWSAVVCWAIGFGYKRKKYTMSRIYQILFDYLARNLEFWRCYTRTLKVEYVFFVDNGKIAKIGFSKIINLAAQYKPAASKSLSERRIMAGKLLSILNFK